MKKKSISRAGQGSAVALGGGTMLAWAGQHGHGALGLRHWGGRGKWTREQRGRKAGSSPAWHEEQWRRLQVLRLGDEARW
jgi:hypothetical protein